MVKQEQIPDDAVRAASRAASDLLSDDGIRSTIAAAINAWEIPWHRATKGQALDEVGSWYPVIMLPIPQEKKNDD